MDVDSALRMTNGMMVKNNNNNNNNNVIEPDPQAIMNDVIALLENEIPECQQNLKDNHRNLERVAEYCDTNYFRSVNKLVALEETKNYTTQSLASVAYQITSLAFNILHLLDLQATQITSLESHSNHLAQSEQIHREKVARREIGLFTANKQPNRIPKILYPVSPERQTKYARKPIDYSILDDVGHGVKLAPSQQPQQQTQLHTSRTRSVSSAQSINGGSSLYGPGMSISGLSGSSIPQYRNPAVSIAPPQVPSNYAPTTGLVPPSIPQTNSTAQPFNVYSTGTIRYGQSPLPPPPTFDRVGAEPDWVPKNYIEKVIALYDYTKEKPDELNLCENAIIYVTKKNEDGWYEGVLDGEEGLFPCNYVEPLRDY